MLESEEEEISTSILPPEGDYHAANLLVEVKNVHGNFEHHASADGSAGNVVVEELTLYDAANAHASSYNHDTLLQNQWQRLYKLAGGSGSGTLPGDVLNAPHEWGHSTFSDLLPPNPTIPQGSNEIMDLDDSLSPNGIRTKIISKSGFSEFFVRNTLKAKGYRYPSGLEHGISQTAADALRCSGPKTGVSSPNCIVQTKPSQGPDNEVRLRQWLKAGHCKVPKSEKLHIFKQILSFVDSWHSQGVPCLNLRPSCFAVSPLNQVTFTQDKSRGNINQVNSNLENRQSGKRPMEFGFSPSISPYAKKPKFDQNPSVNRQWPQFSMRPRDESDRNSNETSNTGHYIGRKIDNAPSVSSYLQLTRISSEMENEWYTSPEEKVDGMCTRSSNIYALGVLLFELLGSFDSEKAHATAMLDLQYRILPPNFLSENPKEAGFCLWLLHPEPSLRPTTREILRSEFINELEKPREEELSSSIEQADAEAELLLHLLVSMKEKKEKLELKLVEESRYLEVDIKEIEKRRSSISSLNPTHFIDDGPFDARPGPSSSNDSRLIKNMDHLESAYFSMRSTIQLPETDANTRPEDDLLEIRENLCIAKNDKDKQGGFFDGLCKYARYSKFEVRSVLRNGESMNSANVISSLSFDRDEEYFATAGVSKKIKIFEFQSLFNDSVEIHYPAIEMPNKSRLTCVSWNNYIKNYMASTDYDGLVKLWDVNTGQAISHYLAHQKRAWSVDFSQFDPTKLVSGSDDCSVKLWSINEKNCLGTIRKSANVCSVQFSAQSYHLLGFGSSDYKIYCYDLRNARSPWCTLVGHDKAVSYVRFLDSETLVSASTDNTIKLWDLNKTSSTGPSTNACSLKLSGHTNEKNFVGLSVADGYISCGSETNEVYAYHKSLPMPVTSYKFGSIDKFSGKETDDDNGHFVSSVCWKGKSDMVIAANSTGCIKVLQMV